MKFTLFDADDLKMMEDMLAKAMTRAIVSALKIASRQGLLRPEAEPEPEPVSFRPQPDIQPEPATPPPPEPEPPPPEPRVRVFEPRVPVFLKPPPEHPFPNGRAVEPPPRVKNGEKSRNIYLKLYRTVADRPEGYITIQQACEYLGGQKFSGPVSTWLQKGELEACIVANEKPPTKRLPGRLMIRKESLVERDKLRRKNRGLPPRERQGMAT